MERADDWIEDGNWTYRPGARVGAWYTEGGWTTAYVDDGYPAHWNRTDTYPSYPDREAARQGADRINRQLGEGET